MDKTIKIENHALKLTHLDKILWSKLKITKGDLLDYYQKIAKYILPYLANRPVTVERCPNGIGKECWVQKDAPENLATFVKTYSAVSKTDRHKVDYVLVNNLATLLWLANLDSIEFHIWFSCTRSPNVPDWLIFDLDLVKGGQSQDLIKVAFLIKKELVKEKLILKTTGRTGLHILMENKKKLSYKKARVFVRKIVQKLDKIYPDLVATEARIAERKGKIFIDPAQNSKGRTMICPYSLRAVDGATISMPISWQELKNLNQKKYNIRSVHAGAARS